MAENDDWRTRSQNELIEFSIFINRFYEFPAQRS